jgi:hypothetical protein
MDSQALPQLIRSNWWQSIFYRVRQFFQGLNAQVSATERQMVAQILPEAAVALFLRMPRDAQRHSLNVLYTLQAVGHLEADLAVAALLHDVGKVAADDAGVRLGLWLRGPLVILEALAPQTVDKLAAAHPQQGWRYALYVQRAHPQIGAAWASQAGCTPGACWLIEHHQAAGAAVVRESRYALLAALQQADNSN